VTGVARGRRRRPGQLPHLLGVPAVITALVMVGGPMVVIVVFSLLAQPELGGGVVWRLSGEAYRRFLFDTDFLGRSEVDWSYVQVFGVSFVQAALTTLGCLLLAFPLALWMTAQSPRRQAVLVLLVTIPFWTNLLVRTYAWMLMLSDNGLVNDVSDAAGLGRHTLLNTQFASGVGLAYTFLPFMVLPIYAALERFDVRLAEAAYDLGASRAMVLRRVIYPAARPGVVAGIFLVFVPALGSYVQPELLGGGKSLLIGNLIAAQYGAARNWPFGSALSVLLMLAVLLGLLAVAAWSRRTGAAVRMLEDR
jgi:spermidine/putrescine transport system permease protein